MLTWKDEGVVSLCRHIHLALLCAEGCKGGATGIHSSALRPVICFLSCALSHPCGVGESQDNRPTLLAPLLLYTLPQAKRSLQQCSSSGHVTASCDLGGLPMQCMVCPWLPPCCDPVSFDGAVKNAASYTERSFSVTKTFRQSLSDTT